MKDEIVSCELVRHLFNYDPATGCFYWTENVRLSPLKGKKAGTHNKANGYVTLNIRRKNYLAHRIAWLYMTGSFPNGDIDHIDGNRANNCFSNLREATRSQNMANLRGNAKNTSGFKGVRFVARVKRWSAEITANHKRYHLGYFSSIEDAAMAYNNAAIKHFGEFARLNEVNPESIQRIERAKQQRRVA
ncbi:HNH endonuclease [Pantoea agglomerans]|uniref:HNH endonuclease n=1 Tax=Enterobacter agglomerans TaxID=549 RepID=UPI001375BCBB|nr:HNH endonuclease [Pantoea agglomerans]